MMHTDPQPAGTAVAHPSDRESRWLIGLVAAAVALRVLMLVLRTPDLRTDPDAYVALAETMVETGGIHVPGTMLPTAFRPPLYPLMLAGLIGMGLKSTVAVSLLSVVAGAVITIATWWTARLLGLRGFWCRAATLLTVADPLLLRYTPLPMTEAMTAALLAVAILQLLKVVHSASARAPERETAKSAVLAGVAFALAGYCRPICFLTCGVVTLCLLLRLGRHLRWKSGATLVLPALVCGLLLVPWVIRNAVQFKTFVPLTTHGGYTLLLGNNSVFYRDVVQASGQPVWSESSLANWQAQLDTEMSEAGISSEPDRDRWMYDRAKGAIGDDGSSFIQACLLRWRRFWALQPRVAGQFAWKWVITAVGGWYLLQWVGLIASIRAAWNRPDILVLWASVASFLLVHTFYWTNTRMRAPLTGVIVVLVVSGWEQWVRRRQVTQDSPAE